MEKNLKYDDTQTQYSGVLKNVAELRIIRLLNAANLSFVRLLKLKQNTETEAVRSHKVMICRDPIK